MMRIRMKSRLAGPDRVAGPGDIIDISPSAAESLVAGGYADRIDMPVETAIADAPETSSLKPVRRKRG